MSTRPVAASWRSAMSRHSPSMAPISYGAWYAARSTPPEPRQEPRCRTARAREGARRNHRGLVSGERPVVDHSRPAVGRRTHRRAPRGVLLEARSLKPDALEEQRLDLMTVHVIGAG